MEGEEEGVGRESISPDFYQRPHTEVEETLAELSAVQEQLDAAVERWVELEGES